MIEKNLILILIILVVILMMIMAAMMLLIFKLFMQKAPTENAITPEILTESPKFKIQKLSEEKVRESFYCPNHSEIQTQGTCLICEEAFCEKCLIEHESLMFCKEHFRTFAQNKWVHISDVKTTPHSPEEALYVYHYKRYLWKELQKPSFVITHYKINIEEDFIESFVQLHVLEEEAQELKIQLDKKKGQD